MLRSILYIVLFLSCTHSVQATIYYISPTGSDSASGTSTSTAWRTIAKVNTSTFAPGDEILFEGSKKITGSIYLGPNSYGSATSPIVVSSYGIGDDTINAVNSFGLYAYNTAGIVVRDIIFAGSGDSTNTNGGIIIYTDTPGNISLRSLSFQNVEVYGFKNAGLSIGAYPTDYSRSGYRDINITNCKLHNNGACGLSIYGYYNTADTLYAVKNVYVGNSHAYNNRGLPGATGPSGNGIVIGQVDSAVIEYTDAYNNGDRNNYASGPAGIWAWDSKHIIIQHCESHHNHSTTTDGDGFDLDGGTSYSYLQYNYSHDNDGAGFLVCQYAGARFNNHNIVRFNISENDGEKGNVGSIFLYTPSSADSMSDISIFNNTIYTDTARVNSKRAFLLLGPSIRRVFVANNIFMASGNYLIEVHDSAGITFLNNAYNDQGGIYKYLGINYDSLPAFRIYTGQEMLGSTPKGIATNILTRYPGSTGNVSLYIDSNQMKGYMLLDNSPAINGGIDLSPFGISIGAIDIFEVAIPAMYAHYDIGASYYYYYPGFVPKVLYNDVKIYPNPSCGKITLESSIDKMHYILYNFNGTKLFENDTHAFKTELDIQSYPTGNYILQLSTKDRIETKKLVKY